MSIRVLDILEPATTEGYVVDAQYVRNLTPLTSIDSLRFIEQESDPTYVAGTLYKKDGILNYQTGVSGTTLQIGLENYTPIHNGSATQLSNGYIAYVYGANVDRVDARPASNGTSASRIYGIATHDIAGHADGLLTTFGEVHDLNTQAHPPGTRLYTSDTPGAWTATEVPGDKDGAAVGMVIVQNPNQGSVLVDIERMPRLGGTTANRFSTPRKFTQYFDETLGCPVWWNGSAWVYALPAGYTDVMGTIDQSAAVAALTYEAYRDTPAMMYFMRHDQDDALTLRLQMPHNWLGTAVELHAHVIGMGSVTGNLRLDGYFTWSRPGGPALPALSGWTQLGVTQSIAGTSQYAPQVISLGSITPPTGMGVPSAILTVYLRRPGSSSALDTYEGSKTGGTAAANVGIEYLDCHVQVQGFGTAGLYS